MFRNKIRNEKAQAMASDDFSNPQERESTLDSWDLFVNLTVLKAVK